MLNMKTVAFIPIKLNSQRLPRKNLLPLGNHPLCWHITNTLLSVKSIDEVYVYCSDENIIQYLPSKAKFKKRSTELDGDLVKGAQIYTSFIKDIKADVYILAHTTSPFIKSYSVENALEKVLAGPYDSAFSAQKFQTFAWYKQQPINYDLEDIPRTQDLEPIWIETSGFFIFKKEIFTNYHRRIGFHPFIQQVSDMEAIDIDEKADYEMALKFYREL